VKTIIHDGEPTICPGYRHCSIDAELNGETLRLHFPKESAERLRQALNRMFLDEWSPRCGPLDLEPGEGFPAPDYTYSERRKA